jgi:hypothetical protein
MNPSDIAQLAQQATNYLRPELLLLAGKAVESAATESGKQIVTWFRDRLGGKSAEAALDDAAAHPEDDHRLLALQIQIEIVLEENESFRRDLLALIASHPKSASMQQTANVTGNKNKIGLASGQDIKIRIS